MTSSALTSCCPQSRSGDESTTIPGAISMMLHTNARAMKNIVVILETLFPFAESIIL